MYILLNIISFTCDLRERTNDEEGNLLDEKLIDANEVETRKKITTVRNVIEDLIQRAKSSNGGMDFLVPNMMNIEAFFDQIIPSTVQGIQEEYECFISCKIPDQIQIHPPTDVHSRGRNKRIKRAKELLKACRGKNAKKDQSMT
jgi:hypothetical protein